MRVNWIAYNTVTLADGRMYSPLASARYRVIQPIAALARRGHAVTLVQIGADTEPDEAMRRIDADVVVFSKLITPRRDVFAKVAATARTLIERLRSTGRRVVADVNDNYFDHPFYGAFFRDFVCRVDAVVTSTPEMSASVAPFTDRAVYVVTDPFEGPCGAPRFNPPGRRPRSAWRRWIGGHTEEGEPLRLVWFGHPSNWEPLRAAVESLLELRGWMIELEIITTPDCGVEEFCDAFNAKHGRVCQLRFTPWSLAATWEGLARSAVVLIPSWPDDANKAVKSPNRLVESLRAGRFAVANSLPAYRPLAHCCWLGDSIAEGLEWALDHPDEARRRVIAGQALVATDYSPEGVARAWEAALAGLPDCTVEHSRGVGSSPGIESRAAARAHDECA